LPWQAAGQQTYRGPRWRYGLRKLHHYPSRFRQANNAIYGSHQQHPQFRFGTLEWPRRLSDAEVPRYDLVLIGPALRISDAFIATWGPRYDEKDHDEGEYGRLLRQVSEERATGGGISGETFAAILFWKWKNLNWARNSRHVKWNHYDRVYAKSLARDTYPPHDLYRFRLARTVSDRGVGLRVSDKGDQEAASSVCLCCLIDFSLAIQGRIQRDALDTASGNETYALSVEPTAWRRSPTRP
jgi:hypothetical protein